jgi:hypothetical protein
MLIGKREKSSGYAKYPGDTKVTEWLGGTDEWIEKKKKKKKKQSRAKEEAQKCNLKGISRCKP